MVSTKEYKAGDFAHNTIRQKELLERIGQTLTSLELHPTHFGFSLFMTWNWIAFFSTILTSNANSPMATTGFLGFFSGIANCSALIVIALFAKRISALGSRRTLGAALSLLGGAGTLMVVFGSPVLSTIPWVLILGSAITGVSAAWIIASWGEFFSSLSTPRITAYVLGSFGWSFIFYFVIILLPGTIAVTISSLLLPGCGLLALLSHSATSTVSERPDSVRNFFRLTWRTMLTLFTFCLALWIITLVTRHSESSYFFAEHNIALLGAMLMVVILTVIAIPLSRTFALSFIYRLVLPLTIIGLMFIAIFGIARTTFGTTLILSAFTCFDLFYYIVLADIAKKTGILPARAFGWGRAVASACPVIATLLTSYIFPATGLSESITLISIASISVLAVVSSFLLNSNSIFEKDVSETKSKYSTVDAEVFARQCKGVMEKYKLSEREAQVLLLVAHGRSVPHIADRLCIAKSTVKTHTTHIYQKMGVTDRQEMLDVIETFPIDSSDDGFE